MKRLIAVVVSALCLSACNTDGFEELSTVYVDNHYPNSGATPSQSGVDGATPTQTLCASLTKKTCQQIKDSYPVPVSPYDTPLGCTEVQQQHQCFKDKDADNDGFLCDTEYNNACKVVN